MEGVLIFLSLKYATLLRSQIGRFVDFIKLFKDYDVIIKKAALQAVVQFFKRMGLFYFNSLPDINAVDFIKSGKYRFRLSYTLRSFFWG